MDDEQLDLIELSGRSKRHLRPMALAGVAVVALAAGAGVAYAATNHSSPSPTTSAFSTSTSPSPTASAAPFGPRQRHGKASRFSFGGLGAGGNVEHGQVVIRKSNGTDETIDIQRGTVAAVGSTSITVKSTDGYTATYAVSSSTIVDAQSAGIGSVKTGDTVSVEATVSGSAASAVRIGDSTALKNGRAHFGFATSPAS
jgi:hypothetical protein